MEPVGGCERVLKDVGGCERVLQDIGGCDRVMEFTLSTLLQRIYPQLTI